MKKPVNVQRPGKTVTLTTNIDIFVDLPSKQKASHMSRNVEIIGEVVDESVRKPVDSLESLCASISKSLLKRHEYANYAEVSMKADYFLERAIRFKKSLENYKLMAKAIATREDNGIKKMIGVEVTGMTTCPCAMESVKSMLKEKGKFPKNLRNIPIVTHNQRNITTLMIEVPEKYEVEADDLIAIVEDSVSSPTYEILKRHDEAEVVYKAHLKPRFVEDVVRAILGKILKKYNYLPDEVHVTVRSESEESIHKHNAFAERDTTLGELRK